MSRPKLGFVRNTTAGPLLDLFLVSSVGSVLITRAYLAATGYPQIGNGKLHIAHVLWGGLLMLVALVVALTTINNGARRVVALAGGIGFGLFIDEVGKFVTSDVDYFFKPAVAIIYACFIALFFTFRFINRDDNLTPSLALANAIALLAETPSRLLSNAEKAQAESLLARAGSLPLAQTIVPTVRALPTSEQRPSRLGAFIDRYCARPYERFAQSRAFIWIIGIEAFFGMLSLTSIIINVVLLIPGSTRGTARQTLEAGAGTSAAAIGTVVAGAIYAVMMTIGFLRLRRSRLRALIWFDRAYVFSILVLQVFLFAESQFAALSGFVVTIIMWGAVRIALEQERVRLAAAPVATNPASDPGSAAVISD